MTNPSYSKASLLLYLRQFGAQFLGVITGILLARNLTTADFGIYAILTFQFFFHLSIGDLGLGGSVLREKKPPLLTTLRLVQGCRHFLDLLQILVVGIFGSALASAYGFGNETSHAFLLVSLAAGVQSFQIIPTVLMERELKFGILTAIELTQAFVFSLLCVYASYSSTPIIGIGYAWVAYAATGALLALFTRRWSYGISINFQEMRERLVFSIPYQAIQLATLLRDSFTPIAIGFFLGASAVGQMSWATTLALSIPVGSLVFQRLFLPVMAKLQEDSDALRSYLYHAIFLAHNAVVPLSVIVLVLSSSITEVIFGEKWTDALPLFYLLWPASLVIPFLAPIFSLFNALARPKEVLRFTIELSCATWVLGLPMLSFWGTRGYALAACSSHLLILLLTFRGNRFFPFSAFKIALPVWALSGAMGGIVYLLTLVVTPNTIWRLLLMGLLGIAVYSVLFISIGFRIGFRALMKGQSR